ncbi:MAG TPA: glycosyltransferase family 2 protein [Solirubrobacteraceae bacterium]|nr:glycosyltransferase family 2 protein [Solirubrobacteraceae bacterium]
MSLSAGNDITLVVPTYNRAQALRANLDSMLALRDVAEIVIVDDGSTDDTRAVCAQLGDDRLRVIPHPTNRGVSAARNTGVAAARGEWVLFGEDDCRFPADYATVLRAEAERHGADVVGAPLIHTAAAESQVALLAARAPRRARTSIEDVDVFPSQTIETPFLPARALVRRAVFADVRYHDFPVNGYREETDFFVQAARAGYRCILTPATYCYQLQTWSGGQHHSSTLRYEYWALRNNWSFLRRHGGWLVEHGYIPGVNRAQLRFVLGRGRIVLSGALRARLGRARRAPALRGGPSVAA